ncbi:AAA family ATPase [Streptomonospora nanhaiensis]|uniref:Putative ATPase n=1 Tax=Streptomonospora nanhaiensis TaxID=1323731 RepID=A0A853BP16_9ACTN|nr:AAA family ATPase [Streptomonospora nanhaiensis]MBV2363429.1 AAA family ATPase [Streptomonospora nanhaiensis]NYI96913.1 putative ATPase [Streptomonospora nanhaiensis]
MAADTPGLPVAPADHRRTDRFFVVTGGPGAGKSTLLAHLRPLGLACAPEAGRAVIRDQRAVGGRGLPWVDPALFAELMLSWDLRSHREAAAHEGAVVFDRGVVDVLGYLRLSGLAVPDHVRTAARAVRYHPRVFVAPPWPEIYRTDGERRQSRAEAERTHEAMVAAYTEYGYEPVELPRVPPAERAAFVADAVAAWGRG